MKTRFFVVVMMVLLVSLVGFMAGCATYGAKKEFPKIGQLDQDQLTKTMVRGLAMAMTVFPLNEVEGEKYFGENLLKEDIIALYVEVSASPMATAGDVKLGVVSLCLKPQKNENIDTIVYPMSKEEVYQVIKREYWGKAVFWWFFGVYIGGPISAFHTYEVNKDIQQDLDRKLLSAGSDFKSGLKGFLLFKVPKGFIKENAIPKGMMLKLNLAVGNGEIRYDFPISPPASVSSLK